jgi:HSP20 family protein
MTGTNIIKALDQAFNMPSLFDSTFPNKLLRDSGGWDSYYTTDGFPYDIKVKTDKDGNTEETQLIFAVAGIDKKDINIKVELDRLFVSVQQIETLEDENVKYIRRGLSHRNMSKSFYLRGINKDKIKSELENGLLTITLPTEEKEKAKAISIQVK